MTQALFRALFVREGLISKFRAFFNKCCRLRFLCIKNLTLFFKDFNYLVLKFHVILKSNLFFYLGYLSLNLLEIYYLLNPNCILFKFRHSWLKVLLLLIANLVFFIRFILLMLSFFLKFLLFILDLRTFLFNFSGLK